MAHDLEITNGTASFVGDDPAWHGLGTILHHTMSADEALATCFGDRELVVEEMPLPEGTVWAGGRPLYTITLGGWDGVTANGDFLSIPPKRMPYTGSKRYTPVSPRSIIEIAQDYGSQGGATWSSAGFLGDGRRFFASMRLEDKVVDPDGIKDVIRMYVTALTSFDGSTSPQVFISEVRAVCKNTVRQGQALAVDMLKTKSTRCAVDRLQAQAVMSAALRDDEKSIVYQAEKLLRVDDTSRRIAHKVTDHMFPLPEKAGRARTIVEHKRDVFWEVLLNQKNVNLVGWNGWGVYNAAVEYLDHHTQVNGADSEDARVAARAEKRLDNEYGPVKQAVARLILASA